MRSDKIEALVLELTKRTKKGDLNWAKTTKPAANTEFSLPIIDLVYLAKLNGKYFRVYRYKAKYYRDEYDWEWTDRVALELTDVDGNTLYEFPYDYSLFDLYNAVREKTSGIEEILDELLS